MFVPKEGDARATVWGAWFDTDRTPPRHAAKKYADVGRRD
jgi:hypothetical protein